MIRYMVLDVKTLDKEHLIVNSSLLYEKTTLGTQALIGCGAYKFAFVDKCFALQQNLPLI